MLYGKAGRPERWLSPRRQAGCDFPGRVKTACLALNPGISESKIDEAIERVMNRRAAISPIAANRELYDLIRDGVPVQFDDECGIKQHDKVRLAHFGDPKQNRWLAVSQLWIKSLGQAPKSAYRRPDVILYVNGLPLVFIELKNSNVRLRNAFEDNLRSYRHDIPQLFHFNAFCVLSNALRPGTPSSTGVRVRHVANRVASYRVKGHSGDLVEKKNGEIVDYYNVFRNMRKALKDYAQGADGEEQPVQDKSELFELLDDAVTQTLEFCRQLLGRCVL
ncbi:type I restriction endonuclease [Marinobacter sp. VGCF2001]|uniref:type I restriction endonuclease n=1 Tax=Marinobacter sp. VGCF2001 TaxID=3417189 RepID=UPI003CEBA490